MLLVYIFTRADDFHRAARKRVTVKIAILCNNLGHKVRFNEAFLFQL